MTEIKNMPFSGVSCDEKERVCKVWWLQTKKDSEGKPRIITVETKIPFKDLNAGLLLHASMLAKIRDGLQTGETTLENILRNSEANIQGVEI